MCTAITFKTADNYFGRNLDLEYSYNEKIIVTPKNYDFTFKYPLPLKNNYSIIGIGIIENNYPLYYDAINEKGLCVVGLNFPKSCKYNNADNNKQNIASYELIPWILKNFESVSELMPTLKKLNITNDCFNDKYSATPLHWLIADKDSAITVEQTKNGLNVFKNVIGVLTNEPDFEAQLDNLTKYANLTPNEAKNDFSDELELLPSSRGLGAFGLPGDVSSSSRFVRATFNKLNSICNNDEYDSVNQFFNILGSVKQLSGCVRLPENKLEKTVYTSCYNTKNCTVYYTTYNNSAITKLDLKNESLIGTGLIYYDMLTKSDFIKQN